MSVSKLIGAAIISLKVPHFQMSRGPNKKNWCFTWNNYPSNYQEIFQAKEEEIQCVGGRYSIHRYLIAGKEKGENGTPHLQGYLQLKKKKRLTALKKLFPEQIHWESSRGDSESNITYCSKGATPA